MDLAREIVTRVEAPRDDGEHDELARAGQVCPDASGGHLHSRPRPALTRREPLRSRRRKKRDQGAVGTTTGASVVRPVPGVWMRRCVPAGLAPARTPCPAATEPVARPVPGV